MARMARVRSDIGIYHIMLRGINKQNIFEDDEDRYKLLQIITYFKSQCKYEIYSYCLMNNHVHILLGEKDDSVSEAIKRISSTYVQWYNKKYQRCGHLFQERFKSEPIEDEGALLRVIRYIHQNPIKAGLAYCLEETKWTSYYEYISKPFIVNIALALDIISRDRDTAITEFMDYMSQDNDDQCIDIIINTPITDDLILERVKSLGISNISHLQQMKLNERNEILKQLKNIESASIRQLSRVTGVSKSVIARL